MSYGKYSKIIASASLEPKHLLELKVRVRKGRVSGYVFQQIIDAGLKPAIINLKAVREAS